MRRVHPSVEEGSLRMFHYISDLDGFEIRVMLLGKPKKKIFIRDTTVYTEDNLIGVRSRPVHTLEFVDKHGEVIQAAYKVIV